MYQPILKIEDRSSGKWGKFVEDCLKSIFIVVPEKDLDGIEKVLILDKCPDTEYSWAGGFYNARHGAMPASIELYPPKIIAAQPNFLPKVNFFKKYSIIKMFLHELGHHKCGISDLGERERKAQEYMLLYIKKIYGSWIYLFDLLARIDEVFIKIRKPQESLKAKKGDEKRGRFYFYIK